MQKEMTRVVDMHCHILPGVDDGAASFAQSLSMLELASAEGVTTVVATPHLVFDGSERQFSARIKSAIASLRMMADSAGLPVRIVLGYELLLSPSLMHTADFTDYVIEGTGRLLVEALSPDPSEDLDELLYDLGHMRIGMILAHPERNGWLARHPDFLQRLAQRGVLFQVNAGSITGGWGRDAFRAARRMAACGLVHLIGSDAHSDAARKPAVREALRVLAGWVGEEKAAEIACGRAEKLLGIEHGVTMAGVSKA